jgi:hypothetical protein
MTISRCQRNPDNVDDAMGIGERDWRSMWNSKLLLRLACLLAWSGEAFNLKALVPVCVRSTRRITWDGNTAAAYKATQVSIKLTCVIEC